MQAKPVFRILGPLEAQADSYPLPLPAGKQRTLLGVLLANPHRALAADELAALIWNGDGPDNPRATLYTHLTRLRQSLRRCGAGAAGIVRGSGGGYSISLVAVQLDLLVFRDKAERARRVLDGGDLESGTAGLREALSLWRGPVLPGLGSDRFRSAVAERIEEERIRALDRYNEAALALGRHGDLVAELRSLTREYPYHERFWQHLVLALYRSGRRVEALDAYREVATRLRTDMGMDPSPELEELHMTILRGAPSEAAGRNR